MTCKYGNHSCDGSKDDFLYICKDCFADFFERIFIERTKEIEKLKEQGKNNDEIMKILRGRDD